MRKKLLVTAVVSAALLLTACGPAGGPTPSDSGSPSTAASESPSAEPSTEPADTPVATDAVVVGTCTSGTPDRSIPAIYVATSDDATTPITLNYTVFNADGTAPAVSETVTGPLVTRISYPCTDSADSEIWTFTVTTEGTRVGCAFTFGGQLLAAESQGDGGIGSYTATCNGNPGM